VYWSAKHHYYERGAFIMPVVIVEMWEGRTREQKQKLVEAITKAMVEHCGAGPEHLHVIIHDVPRDSWARNGKLTDK
jgi:4-oxalocrotonate tautomerase